MEFLEVNFNEGINPFIREIKSISEYYPNSLIYDKEENCLKGDIGFHRQYKGRYVEDSYKIQIFFPRDYPELPPSVKEIEGKIPRDSEHHVNPDDTLCLGPHIKILSIFKKEPTLFAFIDKLLIQYLFWHSYVKKYGTPPWPAYSHGPDGIREYREQTNLKEVYFTLLETNNIDVVLRLLEIIIKKEYTGNLRCPCMSGKKLDDCHGRLVRVLLKMPYVKDTHLAQDYWHLKDKYKKRRR
jgi:hypothetical protein